MLKPASIPAAAATTSAPMSSVSFSAASAASAISAEPAARPSAATAEMPSAVVPKASASATSDGGWSFGDSELGDGWGSERVSDVVLPPVDEVEETTTGQALRPAELVQESASRSDSRTARVDSRDSRKSGSSWGGDASWGGEDLDFGEEVVPVVREAAAEAADRPVDSPADSIVSLSDRLPGTSPGEKTVKSVSKESKGSLLGGGTANSVANSDAYRSENEGAAAHSDYGGTVLSSTTVLEERTKALEAELTLSRQQLEEAQRDFGTEIGDALERFAAEKEELEGDKLRLEGLVAELESRLQVAQQIASAEFTKDSDGEEGERKKQLETQHEQLDLLTQQLETERSVRARLESDLHHCRQTTEAEKDMLEAKCGALVSDLEALQGGLRGMDEEKQELAVKLVAAQQELQRQQAEAARKKEEEEQRLSKEARNKEEAVAASTEVQTLTLRVQEGDEKLAEWRLRCEVAEARVLDVEARAARVEEAVEAKAAELSERAVAAERRAESAEFELAAVFERNEVLSAKVSELEREIATLRDALPPLAANEALSPSMVALAHQQSKGSTGTESVPYVPGLLGMQLSASVPLDDDEEKDPWADDDPFAAGPAQPPQDESSTGGNTSLLPGAGEQDSLHHPRSIHAEQQTSAILRTETEQQTSAILHTETEQQTVPVQLSETEQQTVPLSLSETAQQTSAVSQASFGQQTSAVSQTSFGQQTANISQTSGISQQEVAQQTSAVASSPSEEGLRGQVVHLEGELEAVRAELDRVSAEYLQLARADGVVPDPSLAGAPAPAAAAGWDDDDDFAFDDSPNKSSLPLPPAATPAPAAPRPDDSMIPTDDDAWADEDAAMIPMDDDPWADEDDPHGRRSGVPHSTASSQPPVARPAETIDLHVHDQQIQCLQRSLEQNKEETKHLQLRLENETATLSALRLEKETAEMEKETAVEEKELLEMRVQGLERTKIAAEQSMAELQIAATDAVAMVQQVFNIVVGEGGLLGGGSSSWNGRRSRRSNRWRLFQIAATDAVAMLQQGFFVGEGAEKQVSVEVGVLRSAKRRCGRSAM